MWVLKTVLQLCGCFGIEDNYGVNLKGTSAQGISLAMHNYLILIHLFKILNRANNFVCNINTLGMF